MHKGLKTIGLALLVLALVAIVGIYILFWNEINIMESVHEYETNGETTVYIMDYQTDYHLDEVLEVGASSDAEVAAVLSNISSHGMYTVEREVIANPSCEVISAVDSNGNLVWGRNFDWSYSVPIIVRCNPEDGYASIATCEFTNISQNPDLSPLDLKSKFMVVSALYVPMDGINEKGLCVADVAVTEGGMETVDTEKTNLTSVLAVRMLLNKAATVDEAIKLLENYDIFSSGGVSHHITISDATGRAVVVEFFDGNMLVLENRHYVTTFGIYDNGILSADSTVVERYNSLREDYESRKGIMAKDDIAHALSKVVHTDYLWNTKWTMVYEYKEDRIAIDYYFDNDFTNKNTIELSFK